MARLSKWMLIFVLVLPLLSSCRGEPTKNTNDTNKTSGKIETEISGIVTTSISADETDLYNDNGSTVYSGEFLSFVLPDEILKLENLNHTYDGELCIYLQNICDLSLLANLSELQKLSIDENSDPPGYSPLKSGLIADFSFLHSMNNISELTIAQEPQFPLSDLIGMDNLTKISLYGVKISDYDSVVNTVEELTLDSCDFSLEEIVSVFPNLKKLTILGYWDSLSFIGDLQNLETLTLYQTSYQDIDTLANNKKLENLTLLTGNGIDAGILDSPDFLLELKNLKSLEIYDVTLSQDFLSMFLDNCPNCDLQIFKTP